MRTKAILMLATFTTLLACDDRRKVAGGSHGDRDMAQESEVSNLMNRPPLASDALKVEQAMKADGDREFVGWSYVHPIPPALGAGEVFFSRNSDATFELNSTLSQMQPRKAVEVILSQRPCGAVDDRYSSISLGALDVNAEGRVRRGRLLFQENDLSHLSDIRLCAGGLYTWVVAEGAPLACGAIRCDQEEGDTTSH